MMLKAGEKTYRYPDTGEIECMRINNLDFHTVVLLRKLEACYMPKARLFGMPYFWTMKGGEIEFFPRPDKDYEIEIVTRPEK